MPPRKTAAKNEYSDVLSDALTGDLIDDTSDAAGGFLTSSEIAALEVNRNLDDQSAEEMINRLPAFLYEGYVRHRETIRLADLALLDDNLRSADKAKLLGIRTSAGAALDAIFRSLIRTTSSTGVFVVPDGFQLVEIPTETEDQRWDRIVKMAEETFDINPEHECPACGAYVADLKKLKKLK